MQAQKELFGERDGSHATASEISVTQYALPDSIKRADLDPPLAPASTGFTDAADFRRRYADGRIGSDPSLASPERGARLFRLAVDGLTEDYRQFLADP
ncbi:MAG: amidase [Geminicoccaceae bacterium]|jgi:creatinine amidohydrolase|nr:amidase [Geminicoccaceae bacterium]